MFKVTVSVEGSVEKWELEGKLAGDWVKELERCWKERPNKPGVTVQVNLKAVGYVDAAGKQLLGEMYQQGAEIKGCGCMARALVEEIIQFIKGSKTPSKKVLTIIAILVGAYAVCGVARLAAHGESMRHTLQGQAAKADIAKQLDGLDEAQKAARDSSVAR